MSYTFQTWIKDNLDSTYFNDFSEKVLKLEVTGQRVSYEHGNPFKDKYKNVNTWIILSDNSVVGWNESPSRGWSLIRKKNWKV